MIRYIRSPYPSVLGPLLESLQYLHHQLINNEVDCPARSLTNNVNNNGHNPEPRGTPMQALALGDRAPSTNAQNLRPLRYSAIRLVTEFPALRR